MEILRVENVCKTYHTGETTVNALTDISFSVQKGEFVAIIGASGSGKSTLLHILGGIDRPTSGEVIVDGQSVYEQTEDQLAVFRRRQVGLIYQFYNLIPVLNVEENITLPIRLDGRKINKKRLAELLEVLGLTKRRKHLPSQLSGGQQQRVSIGRALINAPAILLADEPTGNLDTQNTQEIMQLLSCFLHIEEFIFNPLLIIDLPSLKTIDLGGESFYHSTETVLDSRRRSISVN